METLTTIRRQDVVAENTLVTQTHDTAFSFFNGTAVTRDDLLRHAVNVSRQLPDGNYALNLCRDRYFFIVAFLAVLLKKQRNLLPPNQTAATVALLLDNYPQSYCIVDKAHHGYANAWLLKPDHFDGGGGHFPPIPDTQTAAVSFTSGSTGQPKAIAKSWGEFRRAARLALKQLHLFGRAWHIVSTVPPQHMYGLETSLFWPLESNLSVDNRQPFFPEDIRCTLQSPTSFVSGAGDAFTYRPCLLISTPTHLKACSGANLSWRNIATVLSSTGPLTPDLAQAVECRMHAPLLEIFGSTETQSFASRRLTLSPHWTPYAGVQISRSADGSFRLSGGHLRRETVLDDRFDIAADGRFTLVGRNAELVKVAGKRISLAELNSLLTAIDGVEDGVFFQGPNERLGALVVTDLSKQQLFSALKPALDAVFFPRPLYRVARLPRNALGKIDRKQLQELIDACQRRRDI
ncbi:MAG: AMP-binding protein [Gammaproteobacteria bacterium]